MTTVLAVDPGRAKCGVAVVRRLPDARFEVRHRSVTPTNELPHLLASLVAEHAPDAIIVGDGTTHAQALAAAHSLQGVRVELVDEKDSTLAARKRYFIAHPPQGLRKLIPVSLQTPSRPYDDYVAVILAERYLSI